LYSLIYYELTLSLFNVVSPIDKRLRFGVVKFLDDKKGTLKMDLDRI